MNGRSSAVLACVLGALLTAFCDRGVRTTDIVRKSEDNFGGGQIRLVGCLERFDDQDRFVLRDAWPLAGESTASRDAAGETNPAGATPPAPAGGTGMMGRTGGTDPSITGMSYLVRDNDELEDHVGHQVEVTGSLEAPRLGTAGPPTNPMSELNVDSVRLVSTACRGY